jgi:hypothetical protein
MTAIQSEGRAGRLLVLEVVKEILQCHRLRDPATTRVSQLKKADLGENPQMQ